MATNVDADMCVESDSEFAKDTGAKKLSGISAPSVRATSAATVDRGGSQMKKRSAKIQLTNEGRVLKQLRLEHGLSMRRAAELIRVSTSIVAHVETGRLDAPRGWRLERFLRVYGDIKTKSFYERVRTFQEQHSPILELQELLRRANDVQIRTVLAIVRGILG